jgi:hypothetical protein
VTAETISVSRNINPAHDDALSHRTAEARRSEVLALLAEAPARTYAMLTEPELEPDTVILFG